MKITIDFDTQAEKVETLGLMFASPSGRAALHDVVERFILTSEDEVPQEIKEEVYKKLEAETENYIKGIMEKYMESQTSQAEFDRHVNNALSRQVSKTVTEILKGKTDSIIQEAKDAAEKKIRTRVTERIVTESIGKILEKTLKGETEA